MIVRPLELPFSPFPSVGVLGLVVERDMMDDTLIAALGNDYPEPEQLAYLVDDAGYIVGQSYDHSVESRNASTDEFLGDKHPGLFRDLVERGVFVERFVVGYNLRNCESDDEGERISNSARSMFSVSLS